MLRLEIFYRRNKNIGIWLLLGALAFCLTACNTRKDIPPAPTLAPETDLSYQSTPGSITANGVLLPVRQVRLSFDVGGSIESIAVEVAKGGNGCFR